MPSAGPCLVSESTQERQHGKRGVEAGSKKGRLYDTGVEPYGGRSDPEQEDAPVIPEIQLRRP